MLESINQVHTIDSIMRKGIWKEYDRDVYLFNLYAEYIMRNARLDELQAGIKIGRRNINKLTYADRYHSNGRKWRGTKESFDEGERKEWKSQLKPKYWKN